MLRDKIFEDAFILHETHDECKHLHNGMSMAKRWASPMRIFKSQPLDCIRDYFGEAYALYFAWMDVFNIALIGATIVGIVFFSIGVLNA